MKKKTKIKIIRKRHILLLEVLIAFALIVMCILPLLSPHAFILKTQRTLINEVELDHQVNLLYAGIVEKLYWNEISWDAIVNQTEFPLETTLPYRGTWRFGEPKRKKPNDEAPYTLYVFPLDMTFVSTHTKKTKTLEYHYELFIIRDLAEGVLPKEEEDTPAEEGEEAASDKEGEA